MKKYLHKKFGWYDHMFHPFDIAELEETERIITCRWCEKDFKVEGEPYINAKILPLSNE